MYLDLARKKKGPETATDLLLACHARIRHFSAVACRLAEAHGAPPEQVVEAASAVDRYFTVALPLHVADEDASLAPRLRAAGREGVADALSDMTREHVEIEALVAELSPSWGALRADPGALAARARELAASSRRLDQLLLRHLAREEERVFPELRALEGDASLVEEMRARRRSP